jgi:hypothetical protein
MYFKILCYCLFSFFALAYGTGNIPTAVQVSRPQAQTQMISAFQQQQQPVLQQHAVSGSSYSYGSPASVYFANAQQQPYIQAQNQAAGAYSVYGPKPPPNYQPSFQSTSNPQGATMVPNNNNNQFAAAAPAPFTPGVVPPVNPAPYNHLTQYPVTTGCGCATPSPAYPIQMNIAKPPSSTTSSINQYYRPW